MSRWAVLATILGLAVAACSGANPAASSPGFARPSSSQPALDSPSHSATSTPLAPFSPETTSSPASKCPSPQGGDCLGVLEAGTYSTINFEPPLTYTIPGSWDNEEDLAGNFLLLPPGNDLAGVDAGTSDYIGVYTSVVAGGECSSATNGPEPKAVASCIADQTYLQTTKPQAVEVGDLSGYVLDVKLDKGADGGGLIEGRAPSSLSHGLIPGLTIRLYLLGYRGGSLAIEVDDVGSSNLAAYSEVVKSLRFKV